MSSADPSVIASLASNPAALQAYLDSFKRGASSSDVTLQQPATVSIGDQTVMTKSGIAVVEHSLIDEKWVPIVDTYPCCLKAIHPCAICRVCTVQTMYAGEGKLKLMEGSCCSSSENVYDVESVTKTFSCGFSGLVIKLRNRRQVVSITSVKDVEKIKLLLQASTASRGIAVSDKMARK